MSLCLALEQLSYQPSLLPLQLSYCPGLLCHSLWRAGLVSSVCAEHGNCVNTNL